MKIKKKVLILPVLIIAILIYFFFFRGSKSSAASFVFAEVSRGDLEIITSSTGTLQPVSMVDVGTQVSGRVDRVLFDYNAMVQAGQVLAVLDTLQLSISYRSAMNDVERAQAQYDLTEREYNDKVRLHEKNFISDLELLRAKTDLKFSRSSLFTAQSNLDRAYLNLYDYAIIRSPINGIIIDKNVEEGQTVAASLSAPVLFTIAADLENMEIRAEVDETDIGLIKAGQKVRYTVDAYPEKTFTGEVRDVRLKPEVISNVVIYTVVISTRNPEGILMPGMTATIDFITSRREDVLLAPATALRWSPPEELIRQMVKQTQAEGGSGGDQSARSSMRGNISVRGSGNTGTLWSLDETGQLTMHRVVIGETDGVNTEIKSSGQDIEGMRVIVNRVSANQAQTRQTQAPLGAPTRMRF